MSDMCTDNRFEQIEKYKKMLIEATNIETSSEEMQVIDSILFRFWQMGWLEAIDRMLLVKESARTLMHIAGDSVSAKAFRKAGRFIQNAIDGEAQEFEKIPSSSTNFSEIPNGWIPCKKLLPEEARAYICTCIDAGRLIVTQIKWKPKLKSWNLSGSRAYWKVIAWQTIKPYQPKEE